MTDWNIGNVGYTLHILHYTAGVERGVLLCIFGFMGLTIGSFLLFIYIASCCLFGESCICSDRKRGKEKVGLWVIYYYYTVQYVHRTYCRVTLDCLIGTEPFISE